MSRRQTVGCLPPATKKHIGPTCLFYPGHMLCGCLICLTHQWPTLDVSSRIATSGTWILLPADNSYLSQDPQVSQTPTDVSLMHYLPIGSWYKPLNPSQKRSMCKLGLKYQVMSFDFRRTAIMINCATQMPLPSSPWVIPWAQHFPSCNPCCTFRRKDGGLNELGTLFNDLSPKKYPKRTFAWQSIPFPLLSVPWWPGPIIW